MSLPFNTLTASRTDIKVSVLMITYNQERFIAQALDSVLAQVTDFRYEVVIGEDCSTDRTREILLGYQKAHPDRVRLLLHDVNVGMNANVAATRRACRGQYIALLEGDDYWTSPQKLQKQVDFLEKHPECAVCFHNAAIVSEDGSEQPGDYCRFDKDRIFTLRRLLRGNIIPTCSALFRADLLPDLPEWMSGLKMLDWPIHLLLARRGNLAYLNERMAAYRVHPGGLWSATQNDELKWTPERITMYRLMHAHLGPEHAGDIELMLSKCFYALARAQERRRQYAASGANLRAAGACALRCLRAGPSAEGLLRLSKIGLCFLVSRFARASHF